MPSTRWSIPKRPPRKGHPSSTKRSPETSRSPGRWRGATPPRRSRKPPSPWNSASCRIACCPPRWSRARSEEHTSELQSRLHLVCRLLLEKKNKKARRSMIPKEYDSSDHKQAVYDSKTSQLQHP